MVRRRVSSSTVASFGYNPKTRTLEIEFTSGAIYRYHGVPASLHARFRKAESKGKFFNNEIRARYFFTRV